MRSGVAGRLHAVRPGARPGGDPKPGAGSNGAPRQLHRAPADRPGRARGPGAGGAGQGSERRARRPVMRRPHRTAARSRRGCPPSGPRAGSLFAAGRWWGHRSRPGRPAVASARAITSRPRMQPDQPGLVVAGQAAVARARILGPLLEAEQVAGGPARCLGLFAPTGRGIGGRPRRRSRQRSTGTRSGQPASARGELPVRNLEKSAPRSTDKPDSRGCRCSTYPFFGFSERGKAPRGRITTAALGLIR